MHMFGKDMHLRSNVQMLIVASGSVSNKGLVNMWSTGALDSEVCENVWVESMVLVIVNSKQNKIFWH